MITDIFLYIISFLIGTVGNIMTAIASDFSIWPPVLLNGLTYFFTQLMNWNFFIPIDSLLQAIKFLIDFLASYVSIKLLLKLFNFARGSDGLDI